MGKTNGSGTGNWQLARRLGQEGNATAAGPEPGPAIETQNKYINK